ncbi:hypothetical protein GOP47_0014027 [Adiantum capillus-veneris]|uniref:Uncharacterized protein n=1 Tax=Adiantum capillus-veneris TaxID=13818 RepID=A0A9D4UQC5_ADICA|nr:hypothetical protein GOP47_0014027 [Adiantum capillus-veneris]
MRSTLSCSGCGHEAEDPLSSFASLMASGTALNASEKDTLAAAVTASIAIIATMAVVANLTSSIQKPLGHSQPINVQNPALAATLYSCNEAPCVLGALQEPKTAT